MSRKRKFELSLCPQQENNEENSEKVEDTCSFQFVEQEDQDLERELNDDILQNACQSRLQEILNSLNDDNEYSNQLIPKRPRLSINSPEDSPGSSINSIDCLLSDIRELTESPSSLSSHTPDNIPSTSSTPEVIDLSSPDHHKISASSDVVDLTAEPNSPTFTLVNEVVDLTKETGDPLDSGPVIVGVNKIFERRPLIPQWPSCRFETIAAANITNNDEDVHEVSEKSSGNPNDKPKQDDQLSKNITCPICFDDANLLKRRKRQLNSTICGHVFCDTCIKNAIKTQSKCPTCRRKLTLKQIHPLFL